MSPFQADIPEMEVLKLSINSYQPCLCGAVSGSNIKVITPIWSRPPPLAAAMAIDFPGSRLWWSGATDRRDRGDRRNPLERCRFWGWKRCFRGFSIPKSTLPNLETLVNQIQIENGRVLLGKPTVLEVDTA